ncbi:glycoside hydrolase family 18 protein [Heyndrickxia acidiproducens]|uniref:glycoside hydrolase family 18 protein n=1 Tax=Heyndrickxia acidiproducens TaxID=1121084 RepID=UPI00036B3A7F|nr:glycoside hydrolase family 18 protein [Heyndrickxia acidiproducens]
MFIHTVQPGDSLFSISSRYGASADQIRSVNGLWQTNIVPGQALLIPLYVYIVQPGDTLTAIARKSYVPIASLRAANASMNLEVLQPGMRITIPRLSHYPAGTLSFYAIRSPDLDRALIRDFAPYSTSIAIFEYHFAANGDIVNELNDLAAIQETWNNRVTPLVTITNLTARGFSTELVHQVLNQPAARTNLVNNIFNLASGRGYGGVCIDFEQVAAGDRDLFTGFLQQLKDRFRPAGLALTIAVPAKTSENIPWLMGYDYGGIGSVVDYMFIMAYDWHYPGSEPGPVAPITEVRRTLDFAVARVPRKKILLGLPLYGYDWLLPYSPGSATTAISNQNAMNRAMTFQSPIQYANEFQSPHFRYRDQQGQLHEVWFEDVRSMSEKLSTARTYGIRGVGAWQLTLGFSPGPWLLTKFFSIIKI